MDEIFYEIINSISGIQLSIAYLRVYISVVDCIYMYAL